MRTEQLLHFIEIAKCHSISKAADNLLLNQTSLSNSIRTLENELQQPLFSRTNKGVLLTPFGTRVLEHAQDILSQVNQIHALAQNEVRTITNRVYIYAFPLAYHTVLYEYLRHLLSTHSPYTIFCQETPAETLLQQLITSGHHLGIGSCGALKYSYFILQADNHHFHCEPLYEDRLYAYLNADHPLAAASSLSISSIINEPVLLHPAFLVADGNAFFHELHQLTHIYAVDNYSLYDKLLRQNDIIAIAPGHLFHNDFPTTVPIRRLPIDDIREKIVTFLVYPQNRSVLTDYEKLSLDYFRTYYRRITENTRPDTQS